MNNNCAMSSPASCPFCFKDFVDHHSLKNHILSCSPTKSDTQVDPFEHNLSICVEEPKRTHQDDNPQDSDNEQSELSELSRNISGDFLEELSDLDSFEASEGKSNSCSGKKMLKDIVVEQETKKVPQLPCGINGTMPYKVFASTRTKLQQKLKDDRP